MNLLCAICVSRNGISLRTSSLFPDETNCRNGAVPWTCPGESLDKRIVDRARLPQMSSKADGIPSPWVHGTSPKSEVMKIMKGRRREGGGEVFI